jgi:predicted helicase
MTLDQYLSDIVTAYKDSIAIELYEEEIPDLTEETINQIANKTGLTFILEKNGENNLCMENDKDIRPEFRQTFTPVDILDYMYAILHSSNYRSADKKIIKSNLPYPKNNEIFWELAELGYKIKKIHSLQTLNTEDFITYDQKVTFALSETEKLIKKIDEIQLE